MLDRIKKTVSSYYKLTDSKGIFLSVFDSKDILLLSSGVVITDKPLDSVIDMIYNGLIKSLSDTKYIVCDVVDVVELETSMEDVMNIDTNRFWLCVATIDHSKSGVILPGTIGIHTISDALTLIKVKHQLAGNISIYKFTTDRFSVL